jgi:Amt family ammonium transporter
MAFWLVGFGFAFGDLGNNFIGRDGDFFASSGYYKQEEDLYLKFLFQFAFANTAATIVSGSLAERVKIGSYIFYSFFMTGFIYPVVVGWVWGDGWL